MQYPAKEVADLREQLAQVQEQLHEKGITHEGQTADEAYIQRLAEFSMTDGVIKDGDKVVKILLGRCLLWAEIIESR